MRELIENIWTGELTLAGCPVILETDVNEALVDCWDRFNTGGINKVIEGGFKIENVLVNKLKNSLTNT